MKNAPHLCLHLALLAALSVPSMLAAGRANAEPSSLPVPPLTKPGTEKTIKHIRTEDAGARIDEVRVGGETQKISVQPKSDVPAYEVQPHDNSSAPTNTGSGGKRVWNMLKF